MVFKCPYCTLMYVNQSSNVLNCIKITSGKLRQCSICIHNTWLRKKYHNSKVAQFVGKSNPQKKEQLVSKSSPICGLAPNLATLTTNENLGQGRSPVGCSKYCSNCSWRAVLVDLHSVIEVVQGILAVIVTNTFSR